jgi:hypothetical protein
MLRIDQERPRVAEALAEAQVEGAMNRTLSEVET